MNITERTSGTIVLLSEVEVVPTGGLAIMAVRRGGPPQLPTIGEPVERTSRTTIREDIDPENAIGRKGTGTGITLGTTAIDITGRYHLRRLRQRGTGTTAAGLRIRARLRPRDLQRASTTITIGDHPLRVLRGRGPGPSPAVRSGVQVRLGNATRTIRLACRSELRRVRCRQRGCLGLCRGMMWRWTIRMRRVLVVLHRHGRSSRST